MPLSLATLRPKAVPFAVDKKWFCTGIPSTDIFESSLLPSSVFFALTAVSATIK